VVALISVCFLVIAILSVRLIDQQYYTHEQIALSAAIEESQIDKSEVVQDDEEVEKEEIFVHIVGAIKAPGVYELPARSRVVDAVDAAQGFADDAAFEVVNLAQLLFDGAQIVIPTHRDLKNHENDTAFGVRGTETEAPQSSNASSNQSSGMVPAGLIDINTADAALLETLPGIGPATSQKIINDRNERGPFRSLLDLARIPGIGEKKIEALNGLAEAR
jgi:competence protein ComEA